MRPGARVRSPAAQELRVRHLVALSTKFSTAVGDGIVSGLRDSRSAKSRAQSVSMSASSVTSSKPAFIPCRRRARWCAASPIRSALARDQASLDGGHAPEGASKKCRARSGNERTHGEVLLEERLRLVPSSAPRTTASPRRQKSVQVKLRRGLGADQHESFRAADVQRVRCMAKPPPWAAMAVLVSAGDTSWDTPRPCRRAGRALPSLPTITGRAVSEGLEAGHRRSKS